MRAEDATGPADGYHRPVLHLSQFIHFDSSARTRWSPPPPQHDRSGRCPSRRSSRSLPVRHRGRAAADDGRAVAARVPVDPRAAPTDNASWLVTATLLTSAVATPVVSRLADMFGKRLMMLVCMVAMVAGSVSPHCVRASPWSDRGGHCRASPPRSSRSASASCATSCPGSRSRSAVALMSATLGIGGALGLPLAGLVSEHLGWHAIFWLLGRDRGPAARRRPASCPESAVRTGGLFDYLGAVLLSIALTGLLLAISKGGTGAGRASRPSACSWSPWWCWWCGCRSSCA